MLKLFGGLLLTGGGLAAGLSAAGELARRLRDLMVWVGALGEMERAMAYSLPPLSHLLAELSGRAEGAPGQALKLAGEGLERLGEYSFAEIWTDALAACEGGLDREDLALLRDLGTVLGRWDGEAQGRAIAAVRSGLEATAARLRRRLEREGRVYGVVGLSAGVFLTILFL